MAEDMTTPFAEVPRPPLGEPMSPVTYEQQLASVGAVAAGLRSRPRWVRRTVRAVAIGFAVLGVVAVLISRLPA